MSKKSIRIIIVIAIVVLVFNIIRSFMFLSNRNTFNASGIKIATTVFKSTKDVEVYDNGTFIQVNVILDTEAKALTTDNYVEIRRFFTSLSKMKNDESDIYTIGLDIRTSNDNGICSCGALTKDIFNTDWGSITNTKELASKLDMVFY